MNGTQPTALQIRIAGRHLRRGLAVDDDPHVHAFADTPDQEIREELARGVPVHRPRHEVDALLRPLDQVDPPVERGALLEVERDHLPETGADEYYAFQLLGLRVVEESGRELGTVQAVTPGVANDVLELDGDILLPMVEDCVRRIDLDAGRIEVATGFAQ